MNMPDNGLTATLRQARKARRLSQLELSLRVGVSQRHVSFVESGRSRPSRMLLVAWLKELDAPLALCNAALLQAGFAPAYSAAPLSDPALAQATAALHQLMQSHDPMPALLLDSQWNVLHMNRGGQWLAATLVPWAAAMAGEAPVNLLDLLAHPRGFTLPMTNLHEVGPVLLGRLREEAHAKPALTTRVEAFAALLHSRLGPQPLQRSVQPAAAPVLTTRFATPLGELAFFSMFTTFGTPQDITLDSLKVEHLFAADEATRRVVRAQLA